MILLALAVPVLADGPVLDVKAAMLVDLDSGTILYSENADAQVFPASLTKIMTGYLFAEWADANDAWSEKIYVSAGAVSGIDPAGSTAYLQGGEEIRAVDLLACILIISANEACNVAAEAVSGSIDEFVDLMNETAAELGCTGTHFANTHGLHDENHYTTVDDLRRITEAAIANETFWEICTTADTTIPATNLSDARELHSSNYMTSSYTVGYTYLDERIEGVKTGFTTPAGRCLIVTARQDGHRLLSIVCGAPNTELVGGEERYGHFVETSQLLDYGFENFDTLLAEGKVPAPDAPETPDTPEEPDGQPDPADPSAPDEPEQPEAEPEAPSRSSSRNSTMLYLVAALAAFLVLWVILYFVLRARSRKK